jgi:hypothetical protein
VSLSPEDKAVDLIFEEDDRPRSSDISNAPPIMSIADSKLWNDMSRHIPSEPSTFDSRKGKSTSLLNVSRPAENGGMSPMVGLRAKTPGMLNSVSRLKHPM